MLRTLAYRFAAVLAAALIAVPAINAARRHVAFEREETARVRIQKYGIRMAAVPGGTFDMGDNNAEPFLRSFYTVHTVTLPDFEMSVTEITEGQFRQVMRFGKSFSDSLNNLPVGNVTWKEAAKFCNELSMQCGLDPCYNEYFWTADFRKTGFRLPTEAEWEYACRAGTRTRYYSGDTEADLDHAGWYRGNSLVQGHPVASKAPNALGLYDMSGSALEWCNDFFGSYPSGPATDPSGAKYGSNRVLRGGSWNHFTPACGSAYRHFGNPENFRPFVGFRIARRK